VVYTAHLTDQRGTKYRIKSQCGYIAIDNTWMRVAKKRRLLHSTKHRGCHRVLRVDILTQLYRVDALYLKSIMCQLLQRNEKSEHYETCHRVLFAYCSVLFCLCLLMIMSRAATAAAAAAAARAAAHNNDDKESDDEEIDGNPPVLFGFDCCLFICGVVSPLLRASLMNIHSLDSLLTLVSLTNESLDTTARNVNKTRRAANEAPLVVDAIHLQRLKAMSLWATWQVRMAIPLIEDDFNELQLQ
jgi:hypothetical protein